MKTLVRVYLLKQANGAHRSFHLVAVLKEIIDGTGCLLANYLTTKTGRRRLVYLPQ